MKYKEHLKANIAPEYGPEPYIDYARLDNIIREVSESAQGSTDLESREISLTSASAAVVSQSNLKTTATEDDFFKLLEHEMVKVEKFTLKQVKELRKKVKNVENNLFSNKKGGASSFSPKRRNISFESFDNDGDDEDNGDADSGDSPIFDSSDDDHNMDDSDDQIMKKEKISSNENTGMTTAEDNVKDTQDNNDDDITAVTDMTAGDGVETTTGNEQQYIDIENSSAVMTKATATNPSEISIMAAEVAADFLRLEKYVNINFMGFHKILKKHDRWIPNNPCKNFYLNRLHAQAWVRGDYSSLVVRLSHIHSMLREDRVNNDGKTDTVFLRKTKKYWVKTEDVSLVKYAILPHLPVFLQKTSTGESDSQLVNSVYFDNHQLELYHDRLDKMPGALAVRVRWYGNDDDDEEEDDEEDNDDNRPQKNKTVFVERKKTSDKWTGEVPIKERFVIDESEVPQVLTNTFPIEKKKQEMIKEGKKSLQEIEEWESLVREITQTVASKQLIPTIRTQYNRTAFQIPFDASIRLSLDTQLCMISERGYDTQNMTIWHRDKAQKNKGGKSAAAADNNEPEAKIYRFPHAVLEIKVEFSADGSYGDTAEPKWLTDLQNSGLLHEINRFSKFTMGCSVLLPEDITWAPYWIDDVSLRDSIIASGGSRILAEEADGHGPGANAIYDHLLPFGDTVNDLRDTVSAQKMIRIDSSGNVTTTTTTTSGEDNENKSNGRRDINAQDMRGYNKDTGDDDDYDDDDIDTSYCGPWLFPCCNQDEEDEDFFDFNDPKRYFANERTFISWMTKAAFLSAFGSSILSSTESSSSNQEYQYTIWCAMGLLVIAVLIIMFSLYKFLWRSYCIKRDLPGETGDPMGPFALGGALIIVLLVVFGANIYDIITSSLYASGNTADEKIYHISSMVKVVAVHHSDIIVDSGAIGNGAFPHG